MRFDFSEKKKKKKKNPNRKAVKFAVPACIYIIGVI